MSWWKRLWRGTTSPPPSPPPSVRPLPAPLPATSEVAALHKLRSMARGESLQEEEAIEALRSLTGTPQEKEAIEALRKAARSTSLGESLRLALAGLLQQRGSPAEALAILGSTTTVGGLMLQAELRAAQGDLAGACASLERVLARDMTAPGARERLERWRSRLGLPSLSGEVPLQDSTLFTSTAPATPFRILAEAGRGGAAVVYQAEDTGLGRLLALKVYHRPREARDQIEQEAALAVEAAGIGVIRIFDLDLDRGWLALEWAPGGTLRDHLRHNPACLLPVERWLPVLLTAIARLHRLGWAHGDLKPGNVLFASSGRPLLTDFGLARRPGELWQGGTVGYLSPRRLSGAPASLADDVYALGRLLDDVASALGTHTPPSIQALVEQCLADSPPSVEVLLEGLQESGSSSRWLPTGVFLLKQHDTFKTFFDHALGLRRNCHERKPPSTLDGFPLEALESHLPGLFYQ
ncbi:MAG: hypothetical protein RMJ98_12415 [Myxococcales bacterium]|nr:hypothetical protein [Polyangiaceae bacterium]MDW8250090.1 hypothetical protein [Myxococcales bacterium]